MSDMQRSLASGFREITQTDDFAFAELEWPRAGVPTASAIRAAIGKPRTGRVDLVDGAVPGLTLRLGRVRGATWSLVVRVVGEGGLTGRGHALKGPRRRITLGTYPQVSLHAARAKANAHLDQAKRGESPVEELERAAAARGPTVEGLAEKFLTDYVYLKQLRATRRYEMAIRIHIIDGVGRVTAHPLASLRHRFLKRRITTAKESKRSESGTHVRVAGSELARCGHFLRLRRPHEVERDSTPMRPLMEHA